MASTDQDTGDVGVWNDVMNDINNNGSPFDFESFTNMEYADSPGGLQMQAPSRTGFQSMTGPGEQQTQQQSGIPMQSTTSLDTSSQDSSSDTSSRIKHKNASESPISDADRNSEVKKEDSMMELEAPKMQVFGSGARSLRPMPMDTNIDTNMADNGMFGFTNPSGNSSPINPATFENALSLNGQMHNIVRQNMSTQFKQESPIQTINPATFSLGGDASRNHSPSMMNATMFNHSPNAVFSTPSSDSNETFNPNQSYNFNQNPAWTADLSNQYASPGALQFTPSPNVNGATPSANPRSAAAPPGRSKLHIAPISTKSRVETQINVIMTLETPPPATEYLHLPLHTIAKSKLLAKEEVDRSKALELHTMLVCTSAMRNPELKEKALQRAAEQNNWEIQQRAEQQRDSGEEDKNDPKNIPEEDKPSNGGEVRICNNCIQRERKRAGRKKLKKEEEQQHWERYETERVVVFNSNEFLSFKAYEPGQQMQKDAAYPGEEYVPPEGSMHVTAAMRIACYCRHQSEKEGFQVIFTLKDQEGNVVAQEMSDSILITDDHKTHPSTFVPQVGEQQMALFAPQMFATGLPTHGMPAGLQQSYSMVDMSNHMQPAFSSSRSTGNLQALSLGQQQFNPQSHVHQLPNSGYTSQATSATMTPTSLSRPASPNSAGNSGPNKKRKSSSFHRRVPSGLTMTPRVDTNHGQSSNMPSAMSAATSPEQLFSPTNGGFNPQMQPDQSYMTIPNNNGPAQFISSGPPTPAEQQGPFTFNQAPPNALRRDAPQQIPDYYQSLPGSRVGSRAPSPVAGTRANLAAYARHQMAPSSQAPPRQQAYSGQAVPGSAGSDVDSSTALPMIHKLTPAEGPTAGGTEVSIYGRNFTHGCQVYFGEQPATALTFYGDQSLLCVSPPGRPGAVHVTIVPAGNVPQYSANQASRPIFNYKNSNERMMEMALRSLSQQQVGNPNSWFQLAQHHASQYVNNNIGRAGLGQGYDGGNMHSMRPTECEEKVLQILDKVEADRSEGLLTLAASCGFYRVVAELLALGSDLDQRDASGYTPLMHSALQGHVDIFHMLLAEGANPAITSSSGDGLLHVAPKELRETLNGILLSTSLSDSHESESQASKAELLRYCTSALARLSVNNTSQPSSSMLHSSPWQSGALARDHVLRSRCAA